MTTRTFAALGDRPGATEAEASGPSPLRVRDGAWWLHPSWTAILTVLPCLAVAWMTPGEDYLLWWRTPKYFGSVTALTSLLLLGAFVAGAMVPSLARGRVPVRGPRLTTSAAQRRILRRAGNVFLALTVTGYAVWMLLALSRGYGVAQFISAMHLDQGALIVEKQVYFSTAPGVTTLTQFGPLALVCLLLDRRMSGRRHHWSLALLAVLTLVRVFINAERLALFEMAIPAVVLAAATRTGTTRRSRRKLFWAALPLLAPLALAVVFAVFEFTRSWNDRHPQYGDVGFGEFIMLRLGGYYATASNNSAILLARLAPYTKAPFFTVPFIWSAPVLGSLLDPRSVLGISLDEWSKVLQQYGNLEFVNNGSLLLAVADYGLAGALIWWTVLGLALGICYRALRSGDVGALILYSVLYIGLLEMGRIFYWGLGRTFPVIIGGLAVSWYLRRALRAPETSAES
ncbi:oligosaccharide repeat unit polymerase [Actinoallomurus rhizosphaericola]|uniref:oligosaccharide repeat unit polymerase n=1 Tax=Actinoallomurus rhizosphaericola TaxID=2952536 RepID=UPI002093C57D|nr:oligosaccharide repeat unit polymerase [Actinoallomurus rhizosphaericola]MCO5998413.1 oligosaccharide repeat unit polymerase [Actinoallomurus rhizosphaericola]